MPSTIIRRTSTCAAARSKTVAIINEFIDGHEAELMELWGRAQRGEKITKVK